MRVRGNIAVVVRNAGQSPRRKGETISHQGWAAPSVMTGPPHTATMAYAKAFRDKAIADMDIAPAPIRTETRVSSFNYTFVRYEADPVVFIGQIGPDEIIEDVCPESIDDLWKSNNAFGFFAVLKPRSIDAQTRDMVKMWMGDKEGVNQLAKDIEAVCPGRYMWKPQTSEWSLL